MAKKLVTTKDKCQKKARMQTKKFMESVRAFIASKNDGVVPPEQECSLLLLENFYYEFVQITTEINMLDSIIIDGRYGKQVSPLVNAQTAVSNRIESMLKELGLTLKASVKMGVKEIKEPESALEQFLSNQNNKQIEKR